MKIKRLLSLVLMAAMCVTVCACAADTDNAATQPPEPDAETAVAGELGELVILYTGDIHNVFLRNGAEGNLGLAAVARAKSELARDGKTVVLVDGGDVGERSADSDMVSLMNKAGYDIAVPGDHDFDFGTEALIQRSETASFSYISCNFIRTDTGETVFPAYKTVDCGGVQVAFVGITTPYAHCAAGYGFTDGDKGEALYRCVQKAIDNAKADGAKYVVCVGHTGTNPEDTPWTAAQIIANTTGMCAYLDAHSHSLLEGETVKDKDDNPIPICAVGSELTAVGEVRIDLDSGEVSAVLRSDLTEEDADVRKLAEEIAARLPE